MSSYLKYLEKNDSLFKEQKQKKIRRELFEWLEAVVFAVVAVVLCFTFIFRIVGVDGESMYPTLKHLDKVVISHLAYTPKNGDIIVITQPNTVNKPLIKRIIAVGGQKLDINFSSGDVKVDGVVLDEPYIAEKTTLYGDVEFPLIVPDGYVFVMGDNRNMSYDSRNTGIGMIDTRYILGRAVFRIYPIRSLGNIKGGSDE